MALLLAHALYKAGLFLVTGIIDHETGTRELDRLAGLRRLLPITAAAAALGALSMAGHPAAGRLRGQGTGPQGGLGGPGPGCRHRHRRCPRGGRDRPRSRPPASPASRRSPAPCACRVRASMSPPGRCGWGRWSSVPSGSWPAWCRRWVQERSWRPPARPSPARLPRVACSPGTASTLVLLLSVVSILGGAVLWLRRRTVADGARPA